MAKTLRRFHYHVNPHATKSFALVPIYYENPGIMRIFGHMRMRMSSQVTSCDCG